MLGIYCRTSKLREVKYTIENQKDGGVKCAQQLGLKYTFYIDDGISGTLDDSVRNGLADLFKDIREGVITHVYVIDQSRIERETNTWRFFVSLCLNYNVRYFPSGNEYNLDDPTNRMLANVMSIFNAYYAEITGKKVREANAKKAALGLTHGVLPFGYTKDQNKKYKVLEIEAKYVRLMFKLSLEGKGAYTIANVLNDQGIPTKFSGNFKGQIKRRDEYTKEVRYFDKEKVKWRGNVVGDILKNPIYKGERVWRRHEDQSEFIDGKTIKKKVVAEVITAEVPGIVTPELFDKVQANFEKNRKNVGRRDEYNYLLNGLIYCEKCGKLFKGKKRLKGNDNAYKCSGKIYPNSSCDSRGIGIPKLDTFIIRYLFLTKEFRNRITEISKIVSKEHDFTEVIAKHEKELTAIKRKVKHISTQLGDPDFSGIEDLRVQLKSALSREKSIKEKLDFYIERQANSNKSNIKTRIFNQIDSINPLKLSKDKIELNFDQVKKAVHTIVDWISIKHFKQEKGGYFLIKLKIADIDEYLFFKTDWSLIKWYFIDIVKRKNESSIDELIIQATKENFDVRKELKNYIHNETKDEYHSKNEHNPKVKRSDLKSVTVLDVDDLYHFD